MLSYFVNSKIINNHENNHWSIIFKGVRSRRTSNPEMFGAGTGKFIQVETT
jgi:hypothetical protein